MPELPGVHHHQTTKSVPIASFLGPRAVDRRTPADALGGLIPHARFTTMVILLINTGLYIAMVLHSCKATGGSVLGPGPATLYEFGAK